MTSILKVDTIQDADGNNIINENSNTITIGASGDTTNIVGTLQNNGSAVGGTNTPAFMVKNGSQSIANTTVTKITGWTEIYDTDSAFASDKFTPGVAGKYNFNLTVALDDVGDQKSFIYIFIKMVLEQVMQPQEEGDQEQKNDSYYELVGYCKYY